MEWLIREMDIWEDEYDGIVEFKYYGVKRTRPSSKPDHLKGYTFLGDANRRLNELSSQPKRKQARVVFQLYLKKED